MICVRISNHNVVRACPNCIKDSITKKKISQSTQILLNNFMLINKSKHTLFIFFQELNRERESSLFPTETNCSAKGNKQKTSEEPKILNTTVS